MGDGDESAPIDGQTAVRLDVWLHRARLFKTRSLASRFVEAGGVRLTRDGVEVRVDKASRLIRPGDLVVYALGGRAHVLRVAAVGERRGPPAEARTLYVHIDHASSALGGVEGAWR